MDEPSHGHDSVLKQPAVTSQVQAHGEDAGSGAGCELFFLPHRPLSAAGAAGGPPLFLLMKGCGWTGAGADHFEPLICSCCPCPAGEPYIVL